MMQYYFITEMSTYIDEEKPVTNEKLSELTENALEDPKMAKRIRIPPEVIELCKALSDPFSLSLYIIDRKQG